MSKKVHARVDGTTRICRSIVVRGGVCSMSNELFIEAKLASRGNWTMRWNIREGVPLSYVSLFFTNDLNTPLQPSLC